MKFKELYPGQNRWTNAPLQQREAAAELYIGKSFGMSFRPSKLHIFPGLFTPSHDQVMNRLTFSVVLTELGLDESIGFALQ